MTNFTLIPFLFSRNLLSALLSYMYFQLSLILQVSRRLVELWHEWKATTSGPPSLTLPLPTMITKEVHVLFV